MSGAKHRKKILSYPFTFLSQQVQLVVLVSDFVMVSTVLQFLVCCFSTHGAPCPAICKSRGHVPPVPYGVSATVRKKIQYMRTIIGVVWQLLDRLIRRRIKRLV